MRVFWSIILLLIGALLIIPVLGGFLFGLGYFSSGDLSGIFIALIFFIIWVMIIRKIFLVITSIFPQKKVLFRLALVLLLVGVPMIAVLISPFL